MTARSALVISGGLFISSELHLPALASMSIEMLAELHDAAHTVATILAHAGSASDRKETLDLLHGLSECFVALENATVDELAGRVPATEAERWRRLSVLLQDLALCSDEDSLQEDFERVLKQARDARRVAA